MYKINFSNFIEKQVIKSVIIFSLGFVFLWLLFIFNLLAKTETLGFILISVVWLCAILICMRKIWKQLKGIKEMKKTIENTTFLVENLPYSIEFDKKGEARIKVNYNNTDYYSYPIYCKLASKNRIC